MAEGWIKIHRSLKQKAWFRRPDYVVVWIYILTTVVYEEQEYLFDGKIIRLKAGQFVTTRKDISEKTGVQESAVERVLKCFQNEQQIEQQTGSRSRLISVLKWSEYQNGEQVIEQQMNNSRTTDEQQMNTNKEYKKEKKVRNKEIFTIPALQQVIECMYDKTEGMYADGVVPAQSQAFLDYHNSKGWMVGKAKMKSWEAAVGTWIGNMEKYKPLPKRQVRTKPEPRLSDYFTQQDYENAMLAWNQQQ